jgi:transcription initiation factor TFIIE subunit alpha
MSHLSEEGIVAKCHELVYQVGYSFYDAPYILLLNLLVYSGP